ncbi:MAG: hypothetical protein IGS49_23730 [Chlorogloeopsis fritschii C42_A2020_084]|uniref:hypothetical protein n=1 Tax=Chlorogloeopsis fritschii TaxID=1124 RepID=UPI0019EEEE23|nr:hypothetical protein [Chlorogloeopsis fritschii]MBF2008369.1 hypothetical protein [Chlorogloeopsis fritschii C42_A2020_084]
MQHRSEEAKEARKPESHVIDQALQYYEQGKDLASTQYKGRLEKAIEAFEALFDIVKNHHDPTNPLFFRRSNILPDAHEYCGLTYLKLSHERSVNHPELHLKKSVENFLSASYYRSKISRKSEQSSSKWEEIKSSCDNYIEEYKQGEAQQKSKDFFSSLISHCFNQLIYSNASMEKIKDAIMDLEIIDLECELDNFSQEILTFYARLYEYRGYSYKRIAAFCADEGDLEKACNVFYAAKRDLERSCNIYDLVEHTTLEIDEIISVIEKTIQKLKQNLKELRERLEEERQKKASKQVVWRFLKSLIGYFLSWVTSLCSFLWAVILFVIRIEALKSWVQRQQKDQ